LGQEQVTKTLQNAVTRGRVPHAVLLCGPRGVGKTSIARILAKSLNCETGPTPEPCNVCTNCREITDGISLDVREIDGASNRGIDEIRELREMVNFAPANSPYRVYIIDEVHMLTREAANALLKTLEEPPTHVVFVFATTEIHKLPATILSRCQTFELKRISRRHIALNLAALAEADGIAVSERALSWLAEAADGSLRDAQGLLEQVAAFAGGHIEDSQVEEILVLGDRRFAKILGQAVFRGDAAGCLDTLEEAYAGGADLKHLYGLLLKFFRDCLLVKALGQGASLLELPGEERQELAALVSTASLMDIQRRLDCLLREEERFRRASDPRISLEVILLKIALLPPQIPIHDLILRLEALERRLKNAGGGRREEPLTLPAPEAVREPRAEREPFSDKTGSTNSGPWEEFQGQLRRNHPILYSKVSLGHFLGYEEGLLRIGFPGNYLFWDDIKDPEKVKEILATAADFFPKVREIAWEAMTEKSVNGPVPALNGAKMAENIRREALNHPALLKVMAEFPEAEVREVIIRKAKNHKEVKSIDT
jgi:DNA polymerase-3 subunit gamma/tau